MEMKLLGNVELYCIKVDYFMCSDERGFYTEPLYLSIDTETKREDGTSANLIKFEEDITPCLRVFDTEKEANEYMNTRIKNPCYCENPRLSKIKYDFENGKWKEV